MGSNPESLTEKESCGHGQAEFTAYMTLNSSVMRREGCGTEWIQSFRFFAYFLDPEPYPTIDFKKN